MITPDDNCDDRKVAERMEGKVAQHAIQCLHEVEK